MNTVVLPENTTLVSTIRHGTATAAVHIVTSSKRKRVQSHVYLFSKKVWASKVMYRGSAADFLVVLCKPRNLTTNATEGDYTHLDNFLWLSSIWKIDLFGGCSSRVLGGLLRKTAVSGAMSGSRAENLLMFLLL